MKLPDWANKALDLLEFHEKKIEENGHTSVGRQKNDRKIGWSLRDTAKAKNISLGRTSEMIRLGRAIRRDKKLVYHSREFILRNYK